MTFREAQLAMNPANPIVSVVIPHFNRPREAIAAIRSVEAQTFQDWEVVVVDDGSSIDPTDQILAAVDPGRVRVVRLPKNQGPSVARNTGMREARGRFVAFLDSDDAWLPEKLSRQVAAMMSLPDPDNGVCLSKVSVIDAQGAKTILPRRPIAEGEPPSEYIYQADGFVQTSCVFVSRKAALAVGFRPELRKYEDHLFFIDCLNRGLQYVFVDEVLGVWRNDARGDRLSLIGDRNSYLAGKKMIDVARAEFTTRGRLAFETRYLGCMTVRNAPLRAVSSLIRACLLGVIKPKFVVWVLLRGTLGSARFDRLYKGRAKAAT